MSSVTEVRIPSILFDSGCTNCGSCGGPKISVSEILARPGMMVQKDQLLLTLETNKAVFDVHAPCDGRVIDLLVSEKDLVEENQVFLSLQVN